MKSETIILSQQRIQHTLSTILKERLQKSIEKLILLGGNESNVLCLINWLKKHLHNK